MTGLVGVGIDEDEEDPLTNSDVYLGWLLIGMFLIEVVLMGLETKLESDLIGDCSMRAYEVGVEAADVVAELEDTQRLAGFVSPLLTTSIEVAADDDKLVLAGVETCAG